MLLSFLAGVGSPTVRIPRLTIYNIVGSGVTSVAISAAVCLAGQALRGKRVS